MGQWGWLRRISTAGAAKSTAVLHSVPMVQVLTDGDELPQSPIRRHSFGRCLSIHVMLVHADRSRFFFIFP